MQRKILLLLVPVLIAACTGVGEKEDQAVDSTLITDKVEAPVLVDSLLQGCYSYIHGRDTASLELGLEKNTASGSLSYNFYGKDRNDGSFTGELQGELLRVWYLYRSEGVMSVREEVWKIRPGQLWPASGEPVTRNDTTRFADPSKLSFDSNRAFVKVKCVI